MSDTVPAARAERAARRATRPAPDWAPVKRKLDVKIAFAFALVHVGAIGLCVAYPSTAGWIAFVVLMLGTGLGITVGYHRLLAHRSFRTSKAMERVLTIAGVLAGEAPPLYWVCFHRKHHRFADRAGDPHSPGDGFWFAHMGWMLVHQDQWQLASLYADYAPDLSRDWFVRSLNRSYVAWHLGFIALLFGAGALDGWRTGLSLVGHGVFLRMVFVYHATWLVNSATHTWGSRPYPETPDDSRNLWWVAWLSLGEGWHNNHHRYPKLACHGHDRWQIDVSYGVIRLLQKLRLAWDVVDRIPPRQSHVTTRST